MLRKIKDLSAFDKKHIKENQRLTRKKVVYKKSLQGKSKT